MDLSEVPNAAFVRHPWELSRWSFFVRVLGAQGIFGRPARVLDVGAGDAWFLTQLIKALPDGSTGVGWDTGYEARTIPTPDPSIAGRLSFTSVEPTEQFDLVLMLDVLEHIEHDREFLARRIAMNLAPGGFLLVSIPSWPSLFSSHDTALGHYRRYRPAEAMKLLEDNGLEVHLCGGLFHSLTVPRAMERLLERMRLRPTRRLPKKLEWRGGRMATWFVSFLLRLDNHVSWLSGRHRLRIPGLSFWAVSTGRRTSP
jgi:SAM-dependent methyltransferase